MKERPAYNPIQAIRPSHEPQTAPPPPIVAQVIAPAVGVATYRILSNRLLWFYTHHVNGRTGPHIDEPGRCEGCKAGLTPRPYAYIAGSEFSAPIPRLIQLTHVGVIKSRSLKVYNGDLRGRHIRMWRIRKKDDPRNAGAIYNVTVAKNLHDLLPDFNVAQELLRLWGYAHLLREWIKAGGPPTWCVPPQTVQELVAQGLDPALPDILRCPEEADDSPDGLP